MNEKVYPIDVYGVKKIGVEKWMNNYYIPVNGNEFLSIYKSIYSYYFHTLKQYNDDITYWCIISNIRIINVVAHFILESLQAERLIEDGYEYIVGRDRKRISRNICESDSNCLSRLKSTRSTMSKLTIVEKSKNYIRTLKYNLMPPYFINNKSISKSIVSPTFFVGYRSQQEVISYCRENNICPVHLHSLLFAKNAYNNTDDQFCVKIYTFAYDFLTLVKRRYPIIGKSHFEILKKEIEECFKYSQIFLLNNVKALEKHKPKQLMITGTGFDIHKLFAASWRIAGGEVIGFTHANSYFFGYTPATVINHLLLVNKFVAYSSGQKEILEKGINDFSQGLKASHIYPLKQNGYKRLFGKMQKEKVVNKINKIMLIGFPMVKGYYTSTPGAYAFAQLDLEIRLFKLLKSKGYYMIYKPHPDGINAVEGIFDEYADEVIKERFEDVYDMADCLLFCNNWSTTLGFSLLTKKPVVLIDIKGNYWYSKAFELLKKRCSVVMSELDNSGRIEYDEGEVLDAIKASLGNINYDILYELAF